MHTRKRSRHLGRQLLGLVLLIGVACTAPTSVPAVMEIASEIVAPYLIGLLMPG